MQDNETFFTSLTLNPIGFSAQISNSFIKTLQSSYGGSPVVSEQCQWDEKYLHSWTFHKIFRINFKLAIPGT